MLAVLFSALVATWAWGLYWGAQPIYLGLAFLYAFGGLLIPGGIIASTLTRISQRHPSDTIIVSLISGISVILADYFVSLHLTSGVVIAAVYALGAAAALLPKTNDAFRLNFKYWLDSLGIGLGPSRDLVTAISQVVMFLALYAVMSVYHINPETWKGDFSYYNVDMGWFLGLTNSLTRGFPVSTQNFYLAVPYEYHSLVFTFPAHFSLLFGKSSSLAYMQILPFLNALLLTISLSSLTAKLETPKYLAFAAWASLCFLGGMGTYFFTRQFFIADTGMLALTLCIAILALVAPRLALEDLKLEEAFIWGIAFGLVTVAKGSLGGVVFVAFVMFQCLRGLIKPDWPKILRLIIRGIIVSGVWLAFYKFYFPEGYQAGNMFGWQFQNRGLFLETVGLYPLALLGLLVPQMWRVKEFVAFLLVFIGLSTYFYLNAQVFGNEHYFAMNACFAWAILAILALTQLVNASRWRAQLSVVISLVLLSFVFTGSNTPLHWLVNPKDQARNLKYFEKDVALDQRLYQAIRYIRDNTSPNTIVVHRLDGDGTPHTDERGNTVYPNISMVMGFSDRPTYLGYMPKFTAHAWGAITRRPDAKAALDRANEVMTRLFDGEKSDFWPMEQLSGGDYVVLCSESDCKRLQKRFQSSFRPLFSSGPFSVLAVNPPQDHIRASTPGSETNLRGGG